MTLQGGIIQADSIEATEQAMLTKLAGIVPPFEIKLKAPLVFEINRLKVERDAVILGHNYMEPALFHTVADLVGDSLELSRQAARTEKPVIVFCGVRFMAETAKILNPDKLVLLPARKEAGCSLAASITAANVRELRARFPGVPVVTYVNSYADVKAETDICCTSGNAAKIVASLPGDTVIFIPDEYLARNVAQETGKRVILPKLAYDGSIESCLMLGAEPELIAKAPANSLITWPGRCEVHDQFTVADVEMARQQFPEAVILAHPECHPEVVDKVDFTGSTSKMIDYVKRSRSKSFLLLTECSMADNIATENREKEMVRMCSVRCPHMNQITLEDTLIALKENHQVIDLPADLISRARSSLDRMLAYG
jgi:quinolinate synthase